MDLSKVKSNAIVAEFVGAFSLTFAVLISLNGAVPGIPTPVLAGVVLGLFAMGVGAISGAHLNPAVTIGMYSLKRIDLSNAIAYILAQVAAALLALVALNLFQDSTISDDLFRDATTKEFFAEMLGMLIFTFGVAGAVHNKYTGAAAGLLVGGSLFLGLSIASFGGLGIINPAVALGASSMSWSYLLGPIVGSILGMNLYALMVATKKL